MSTKRSAVDVLANSAQIATVWGDNQDFKLGALTLTDFQEVSDELRNLHQTVEAKRTELIGLISTRDDKANAVNDLVTRARSGFRATYGADSIQYEQAGGTRQSERKRPARKAKATPTA